MEHDGKTPPALRTGEEIKQPRVGDSAAETRVMSPPNRQN
jgi:hypothetical protein